MVANRGAAYLVGTSPAARSGGGGCRGHFLPGLGVTFCCFQQGLGSRTPVQNGAKGVRIQVSGRLGGAEMSRRFQTRLGSIPLSTLQANVDYACIPSHTTYGTIGVKVWVYKGMYADGETDETASRAAGARGRARGRR